jgi:hypothetical protein
MPDGSLFPSFSDIAQYHAYLFCWIQILTVVKLSSRKSSSIFLIVYGVCYFNAICLKDCLSYVASP